MIGGAGRRPTIAGVVLLVFATVGGAYAMGLVGMPSVTGVENRFAGVDAKTTTIETDGGTTTGDGGSSSTSTTTEPTTTATPTPTETDDGLLG